MIYLICVALLILLNIILTELKVNKKTGKVIFMTVAFFVVFILAAFRDYSVGTDTQQFVDSYIRFSQSDFSVVSFGQIYEPGFMFTLWLLSRFSLDPRLFILLTSLFIQFSVCYFIYRHAKDYFSSTILYICSCQFLVSMCMMRQFIAIAIMLLSFHLLLDKKYIRFAIACLLASSFHYFSVLFLLLIPLFMIKKFSKQQIVLIVVLFIPLYIVFPDLMMWFFRHSSNYGDYMESLLASTTLISWIRLPAMILVVGAILLPYWVNRKTYSYNNQYTCYKAKDYSFINTIYFILILFVILSIRFGLFTRVYYYFTPFLLLAPNFVSKKEGTSQHTLYYASIGIVMFIACLILNKGTYGAESYIFM